MANVRILIDQRGVRELLMLPGVQKDLQRRAERVRSAADSREPEGTHEVTTSVAPGDRGGGKRHRAHISTDTTVREAIHDGYLGQALDAGGGT